jgi:predicted GNAT family acetyltransferase
MEYIHEASRVWVPEPTTHKMIAEVLFPDEGEDVVNITHTFVDDSLRGQGAAGEIMKVTAERLRREHKKATLTCPYAKTWFARHPDYNDVIL